MESSTVKNNYEIPIKKCCASCKHKVLEKGSIRICKCGEGIVRHDYLCKQWQMSEILLNVGKGDGKVKKARYLRFYMDYPQPENPKERIPKEQIRKEFSEKFGDIYLF